MFLSRALFLIFESKRLLCGNKHVLTRAAPSLNFSVAGVVVDGNTPGAAGGGDLPVDMKDYHSGVPQPAAKHACCMRPLLLAMFVQHYNKHPDCMPHSTVAMVDMVSRFLTTKLCTAVMSSCT